MASLAAHRHKPARVTDRGRLAVDLARAVRGEVRFDRGAQALYAGDASIYRQVPVGVVIPRDAEDVLVALEVCRARRPAHRVAHRVGRRGDLRAARRRDQRFYGRAADPR